MVTKAIYVRLKAKAGKEADVAAFLKSALPLVAAEPKTATWYALDEGDGNYSIFDTFEAQDGREAHLSGKVAEALMAKAAELFAEPPAISMIDVLANK